MATGFRVYLQQSEHNLLNINSYGYQTKQPALNLSTTEQQTCTECYTKR